MDINLLPNNSSLMSILNIINSPIILTNPHIQNNILQTSFEEQEDIKHPTDKNFIESLEQITFTEDQEDISCGICLDPFKKGDTAFILPCKGTKHYFHIGEDEEECGGILPWLKENNTCPICRDTFPEELEVEEPINININDIPIPVGNFDDIPDIEDVDDEEEEEEEEEGINDVENQAEVNNNISEFLEDMNDRETPSADELLEELSNIIRRSNNRNRIILPHNPFINVMNEIRQEMHQQAMEEDYQLQQAIQRSINER